MQIFGRDVLSSEALWDIYTHLIASDSVWRSDSFAEAAKVCGLKRIAARAGYFSFSARNDTTGQAIIVNNLIEEIRFFIGNEPRNLDEKLWKQDQHKHALLAKEYSALFQAKLGAPRVANNNDMFEYNGYRVRVLATATVWVVMSNLAIVKQLPNDWWGLSVANLV